MSYSYIPFSGNYEQFLDGSKRITQLPRAVKLSGTDFFAVVNEGETRKATIEQLTSVIPENPLINISYTLLSSLSGNWESSFYTVKDLSANWQSTYQTVCALSANWESSFYTVKDLSANWQSTYQTVCALSANWQSVYQTVCALSADWSTGGPLKTLSANWQSTYQTVCALSANWNVGGPLRALSANWQSTYQTVCALSAGWSSVYNTVNSLSDNWEFVYNEFLFRQPFWQSTYETVYELSANWQSTYQTVCALSAGWGVDNGLRSLSGNWQSTYETVCALSANWEEAYNIGTAYQNISSEYAFKNSLSGYLPLSGGIITGDLSVEGNFYVGGSAATINASNLVIGDSLIHLASGNPSNIFDLGLVASYTDSSLKHSGLVRNVSDNEWVLFYELSSDPLSSTNIDFEDNSLKIDTLRANLKGDLLLFGSLSASGNISAANLNISDWNETFSQFRILSGNWQSTYQTVCALSSNWQNGYETVFSLSANWQSTYQTVCALSANWNYQGTDLKALTANWESTYVTVCALSANWNYQGTDLKALTANWQSVYQTVCALSANWEESLEILPTVIDYLSSNQVLISALVVETELYIGDKISPVILYVEQNKVGIGTTLPNKELTVVGDISATGVIYGNGSGLTNISDSSLRSLSANWQSTYVTVCALSSEWNSGGALRSLSANWQSTYQTVCALSANWNYQGTDIKALTANWQSTYVTVCALSANWNANESLRALSGNWQSTYVTVCALSSEWNSGGALRSLSANWQSTYQTVCALSANWNYQGTDIKALTANWQSTYVTVCALSSGWELGRNFANYLPLSGGTITGTLAITGTTNLSGNLIVRSNQRVGIGINNPNESLTVVGNISSTGFVYKTNPILTVNITPYTLTDSVRNSLILINNPISAVVVVPNDTSSNFVSGGEVNITGIGTGIVYVSGGPGVTVRSPENRNRLRTQNSTATLVKLSSNDWLLFGDIWL